MGITIGLFALFLLVLIVVAFAAARLLGGRDGNGKREVAGCLSGCAVGLGLFVLGGLGLAALVAALTVQTASVAIGHNPIRRIYLGTGAEGDASLGAPGGAGSEDAGASIGGRFGFAQDPRRPLHLVFEIAGHGATPAGMLAWIDDWSDGDARVRTQNGVSGDGQAVTWIDVALPASRRDLREIEREVREFVPQASWARGLHIEFQGASREW